MLKIIVVNIAFNTILSQAILRLNLLRHTQNKGELELNDPKG